MTVEEEQAAEAAVPGVVEEVAGGALDEVLEGVQPRTPEGGDVVPGAEGEGVLLVVALRLPEAEAKQSTGTEKVGRGSVPPALTAFLGLLPVDFFS